jgi:hypothetical protein
LRRPTQFSLDFGARCPLQVAHHVDGVRTSKQSRQPTREMSWPRRFQYPCIERQPLGN